MIGTCTVCGKEPSYECRRHFTERIAVLEADLARISAELGLPPKIGPAPGWLREQMDGYKQALADLARVTRERDEAERRAGEATVLAEERLAHAHALQADIEADQAGRMDFRKRYGAREDETFGALVERMARERAEARAAGEAAGRKAMRRELVACAIDWSADGQTLDAWLEHVQTDGWHPPAPARKP